MNAEDSLSGESFQRELREKLVEFFSLTNLRALAFDLEIDFEELTGTQKTDKVISLIRTCERNRLLPALLERLERQRPHVTWPHLPDDSNGDEPPTTTQDPRTGGTFPFINREDEINVIMSSYPPYRVVEAPAGYGKTQLLIRVQELFEEQGWVCAYVAINGHHVDLNPIFNNLLEGTRGNPDKKGIVLLIDLESHVTRLKLERLLGQITRIQSGLHDTVFYAIHPGGFRVILAGRSLSTLLPQVKPQLPLPSLQLSPFDYDVVRRSARNALPLLTNEAVRQFAAHLLHLTGGHPGCMARVIRMYANTNLAVTDFINSKREEILEEIVGPVIDDIRGGIFAAIRDPNVRQFIESNVFRYTYYPVLNRLIEVFEFPGIVDEYDLADKLTTSQLFERDRGNAFLHDGVLRRLAAIHLWYREPDNFVSYCQQAEAICGDYLADPGCQTPARWAIEYLFEGIQQHAGHINESEYRKELTNSFYEENVPKAMDLLTRGTGRRAHRSDLLFLLDGDWEFQFTVNYFLRIEDGVYTERPFQELRERVSRWS